MLLFAFVFCRISFIFFFKKIYYLSLAVLGLHCHGQAFSSCRERRLRSNCGAWASPCSGSSCSRAWAVDAWALVLVEHRLSPYAACGIFPDQESNHCPCISREITTGPPGKSCTICFIKGRQQVPFSH